MSAIALSGFEDVAPVAHSWKLTRLGMRGEELLLAFVFLLALALPVAELVLQACGFPGVPSGLELVKHTTLWIGMIGGGIAAGRKQLIGFTGVTAFLPERWKAAPGVVAGGVAAAISAVLVAASWRFVDSERLAETEFAYGIPTWLVQAVLPLGFAVIALRLLWTAAPAWRGRSVAACIAIAGTAALLAAPGGHGGAGVWIGVAAVLVAAVAGMPIFALLGGLTLVLAWGEGQPFAMLPLKHYSLTTSEALPAVPLFTLAGYFLAEGGASHRLVRVFQAWFGWMRGGPAVVTALVCAFFTTFTGASGVTILALGGLLFPVLQASRMSERNALGLITCSGALGMLFPPCVPLILYAIIAGNALANSDLGAAGGAGVSLEQMFLGGLLPGLLLVLITVLWGVWKSPRAEGARTAFQLREAWAATREAKWELLLPLIALGALFSRFTGMVGAAALTALYAIGIEWLVYRDLQLRRDFLRISTECGLLIGGVLLILGVATGFTNWLVTAEVPNLAAEWATAHLQSPWVFLLLLNGFLLIVGCLMDVYSATVVVVPLILPVALRFGINPVHLGIVFLANLELGFLTPPVGMNLFLASARFNKPIVEVLRSISGLFWWWIAVVLLITYVPWLTTWLPSLGGNGLPHP